MEAMKRSSASMKIKSGKICPSSRVWWSPWTPGTVRILVLSAVLWSWRGGESQTRPQSAHLHFWEGSSNAGLPTMAGSLGGLFASTAGCFCVALRLYNCGEPTHCFVLADSIPGYFGDTLSLVRKTLYKHPAYLGLYGSFSLISHQPLLLVGHHTIHWTLVIFPASLFRVRLRDNVCDSFLTLYTPLKEKRSWWFTAK